MVAIMVASAFAMLPLGTKSQASDDNSAKAAIGGTRSIKYEIYDIGESYLKPTDYNMLGKHDHTKSGINQWFTPRWVGYNDTTIRNKYPYVVSYDPYSAGLSTGLPKYTKASWTTHSFYTLKMDAKNIAGIATGVGGVSADPWFLPIMAGGANPQNLAGGWVNMSMYLTYLTEQEYADIAAGTHYANDYYGVVGSDFNGIWNKFYANDGWLMEGQAHFDFNVQAAKKFLGLPGTGSLIDEFNAKGAAVVAAAWRQEWINDGDAANPLDIYAAYDFSLLSGNGPVYIVVKLDATNSTTTKLAMWFYSVTWGAEALHTRYLWKTGITEELQPYMEDWYLNATFAPTMGDLYSKMTTAYHMTMWKDPDFWNPAWIIEPQNIDYTADNGADPYVSYFDNYYCGYWGNTYKPLRRNWIPGQTTWGTDVHFWQTPMAWNLDQYESLSITLPVNKPGWGIKPYLSSNYSLPGLSAPEQYSNGLWGEWVLGHGRPAADIYSLTYYNPTTKTLSWTGPKSFASWPDEGTPNYPGAPYNVLEGGTPFVVMDIARVSQYNLTLQGNPSPIYAAQTYTLQVKPLNYTGAQAYCNQTVVLPAVAGVTYGASSHLFAWNETIWNTTVIFSAAGTYDLESEDQYYYLDVTDLYQFVVSGVIPEFPTLLIPVIGAAAIFVVLRRRKTAA